MNLAKLIEDLSLLPGLSGHEQAVARYVRSHFESLGLECFEDVLGNVYTVLGDRDRIYGSVDSTYGSARVYGQNNH